MWLAYGTAGLDIRAAVDVALLRCDSGRPPVAAGSAAVILAAPRGASRSRLAATCPGRGGGGHACTASTPGSNGGKPK